MLSRKLIIHDLEKFQSAMQFSYENLEERNGLPTKILYLLTGNYSQADELHIGNDFVKHSFSFCLTKEGKNVMNGGIILHGYQDTFSVELNPSNKPHYSIHT